MAGLKSESLSWVDQLETIRALGPNASRADRKKALNLSDGLVTNIIRLEACFDLAAVEKVRQAAQANPPFILSSNSAKALAGLKKAKAGDLSTFHDALDVTLSLRLTPIKIETLVKWMASGKPASEFDPKAKSLKAAEEITEGSVANGNKPLAQPNLAPQLVASAQVEPEDKTEEKTVQSKKGKSLTLGQQVGGGIDQIVHLLSKSQTGSETSGRLKAKKTRKGKSALAHGLKKLGEKTGKIVWKDLFKLEHHYCRALAHVIVPLHAHSSRSHKSGNIQKGLITLFLTILHWVVYVLLQYSFLLAVATFLICPFAPALKPWVEWPFRFAAHVAIYSFPAFIWANVQTHLGPTLVIGGLLVLGFYYAWKAEPLRISLLGIALGYLVAQGRGFADLPSPWSKSIASETPTASVPTTVPEVVRSSELESAKLKPKTSSSSLRTHNSTPAAAYQPSTSFQTISTDAATAATLYDAKLLQQEIAAVPKDSIIKAYPLMVDETMPGDLAVSRLQDLTDPDKYTMKLGSDTEKILSVNATTTNFIVNYKSTDPFKFLDGAGPLNLFWEDVLYIHSDEIDGTKPASVVYQCSLVVKGAKNVFTVQCASSDDLKHLVSTMEYFIRASRLAHDTALAGMPYPHQGMRLNDKNLVEVLWANSPADKAGLGLGDMVWSVEKNTQEQPDRKKLETQLSALTSGPHDLYIVSPADRNAGLVQMNANNSNVFNPKRKKISLQL